MDHIDILDKLPKHLLNYVVEQDYNSYTAKDHAVWRYVMRRNIKYLPEVAHHSYLEGLKKTGIGMERIPNISGMNRILGDIGWGAVTVDGFIPPNAFMEFQANNVLVIAADIRSADQIEYTPAPDIIHEAAGHAPIIADPEYAEYLRLFGEIGSKAFSSSYDKKMYEAIRHLSILKADPYTPKNEIDEAEKRLQELDSRVVANSEIALIRNLHWWTVEYGLIGTPDNPKIYGAGLLSSIGEGRSSLKPDVKKLPLTIEAVNYNFDITTRQPQLFVTPDFGHLRKVLFEFADRMALRRGGVYGLNVAVESQSIATAVYSSGLQVSGVINNVIEKDGKPVYISTQGPTSLNFENCELSGHDKSYHSMGYGSVVGRLKDIGKPVESCTDRDLSEISIVKGRKVKLNFESGVTVEGILKNVERKKEKIILMSFSDCLVKFEDIILFQPDWGIYDMAVGEDIISVYSGPADPDSYGIQVEPPVEKTHKISYSRKAKRLHLLYKIVRDYRNVKRLPGVLESVLAELEKQYPDEWLLATEIFEEAIEDKDESLKERVTRFLEKNGKKESI